MEGASRHQTGCVLTNKFGFVLPKLLDPIDPTSDRSYSQRLVALTSLSNTIAFEGVALSLDAASEVSK